MTKLKFSDIKSKSKILLDVYWSKLSSNDLPYLSVSIEQVRLNGENVGNWQDQKAAIKLIDPEFSEIVNFHLYDPNGYGMNFIANNLYYFEQLRADVFNLKISKESYTELQDQLVDNFMLNFKTIHNNFVNKNILYYIKRRHYNNSDFIVWFKKTYNVWPCDKRIIKALNNLEAFKTKYHLLSDRIKGAKSRSDIWSIEKYCNLSGIDQDIVKELLLDADYNNKLKILLTSQTVLNRVRLEELTNKFNLTTIKG